MWLFKHFFFFSCGYFLYAGGRDEESKEQLKIHIQSWLQIQGFINVEFAFLLKRGKNHFLSPEIKYRMASLGLKKTPT